MHTKQIRLFYDPQHHDPILLVPDGPHIRLFNITHFQPRVRPPFPLDEPEPQQNSEPELPGLSRRMEKMPIHATEDGDVESYDEERPEILAPIEQNPWPQMPAPRPLFEAVPGWKIGVERARGKRAHLPDVDSCEIGAGGAIILGVGKKSTLYIWKLKQ